MRKGTHEALADSRRLVLDLCREAGIPSPERAFSLTDVYSAEDASGEEMGREDASGEGAGKR